MTVEITISIFKEVNIRVFDKEPKFKLRLKDKRYDFDY